MANGTDWVKFMTERVVNYMETPREQRKQSRLEARSMREPWLTRWFGLAPLGLKVWWQGHKKRRLK
ncbi:YqzE family protein [Paenibacillus sp. GCM10012307]|uniref:YqzE family protein n=1 Tax=Paenibacillus roseus TaxID=2798579 RepID=A0A934J9F7_9BACL|nr:YqzE family protein [Paenibacillus roseus]MBJ6364294.1 YqzE family protein [Paenibacillus roseus]